MRRRAKKGKREAEKGVIEIKKIKIKKTELGVLVGVVLALFLLNYTTLDNALINFLNTNQQVHVDRIIDGDTFEAENQSVRLLGINTPEKGEFLYEKAKEFLEAEISDKNVTLEFAGDRYDKYGRTLAYIFFGEENINVKMVENGLANHYFYSGEDKYSGDLLDAWMICIEEEVNLCEKSDDVCGQCIDLTDDGNSIINNCAFSCNITGWQVKGEGREKFVYSAQTLAPDARTGFALNLENTGGSLFLRDDTGKLVEWKSST